jgi:hypothetical protein
VHRCDVSVCPASPLCVRIMCTCECRRVYVSLRDDDRTMTDIAVGRGREREKEEKASIPLTLSFVLFSPYSIAKVSEANTIASSIVLTDSRDRPVPTPSHASNRTRARTSRSVTPTSIALSHQRDGPNKDTGCADALSLICLGRSVRRPSVHEILALPH